MALTSLGAISLPVEPTLDDLMNALGYEFVHRDHLRDALTHRSFANERPKLAPVHNERLEFLGDAILGAAVASMLFDDSPKVREGALTRRRAEVVCETGLEEVARELNLGAHLRLGKGEERSGGREKPRLLASALEACVGAVFLDGGPLAAFELSRRLFADRVATAEGRRDHKSRIQEVSQARGMGTPTYSLTKIEGPDHAQRFFVEIDAAGQRAQGEGRSKTDAEQAAARAVLKLIERLGEQPEERA